MQATPKDVDALRALLQQLHQSRSELERIPASSVTHIVILAVVGPLVLGVVAGVVPVFVPPYLLLPFVLLPGWRLFQGERERRARLRAVMAQIRIVEVRLGGG